MLHYKNKYQNKNHLINIKNKIKSSKLHFGSIGIISLETCYFKKKELEAFKRTVLKKIKGKGQLIIKIHPFLGVTSKPNIRLGKGKGAIDYWVYPVKKGFILFEIKCSPENLISIFNILNILKKKLSFKTKLIKTYY